MFSPHRNKADPTRPRLGSFCQPTVVDSQEDHSNQDHQPANDLDHCQAFTKNHVCNDSGKDWFRCHDQVGNARCQIRKANVIQSKSQHGGPRREQELNAPSGSVSQPEEVNKTSYRTRQ